MEVSCPHCVVHIDASPTETCIAPVDASHVIFIIFSPFNINILITSSVGVGGGGVRCQTFYFVLFFSVQQTTGGIGHRVKQFFRFGNQYAER